MPASKEVLMNRVCGPYRPRNPSIIGTLNLRRRKRTLTMRLPVLFAKVALIGLLTYGALPVSRMLAEETNQPGVIGDARLAACINQLAQNIVRDGVARVPFTIKIEPSDQAFRNGPQRTRARPYLARRSEPLTARTVPRGSQRRRQTEKPAGE